MQECETVSANHLVDYCKIDAELLPCAATSNITASIASLETSVCIDTKPQSDSSMEASTTYPSIRRVEVSQVAPVSLETLHWFQFTCWNACASICIDPPSAWHAHFTACCRKCGWKLAVSVLSCVQRLSTSKKQRNSVMTEVSFFSFNETSIVSGKVHFGCWVGISSQLVVNCTLSFAQGWARYSYLWI